MSFDDDIYYLERHLWASDCEGSDWWQIAALNCIKSKRVHYIPQRGIDALYMARFWITPPIMNEEAKELESGSSTLLHCIVQGDNDGSMHCHPWDFETLILNGGYTEQLPPPDLDWHTYGGWQPGPEMLTENQCKRRMGDRVQHKATDLHAAIHPRPDTWTMVTTGPRVRTWGFHPPGEKWQTYDKYLSIKSA